MLYPPRGRGGPLIVYADDDPPRPNIPAKPVVLRNESWEEGSLVGKDCCKQFLEKLEKMAWIPAGKKKMKERTLANLVNGPQRVILTMVPKG